MNEEDWVLQVRASKTSEELKALILKLSVSERNFAEFSKIQDKALYALAIKLVSHQKLNALSWEDAWSGINPERPTEGEVNECLDLVLRDARRFLTVGRNDSDFASAETDARMVGIEWACRQSHPDE